MMVLAIVIYCFKMFTVKSEDDINHDDGFRKRFVIGV